MASTWILTRPTKPDGRNRGRPRYRVEWRAGGRESATRYGGSFATKREAEIRREWLAASSPLAASPICAQSPRDSLADDSHAAARWRASRLDVAAGTMQTYRVNLERVLPRVGDEVAVDSLTAERVAELVVELTDAGLTRESIAEDALDARAWCSTTPGFEPNPVRDRRVKLPRGERRHVSPADGRARRGRGAAPPHPLPAPAARARRDRDARRRARAAHLGRRRRAARPLARLGGFREDGRRARWVSPPPVLFEAVTALVAREDRTPERRVFQGFGADRFRTAITRACEAAGVPAFSPHDLRHRRVSLLHLGGMPWARIGELVGHGDLVTTATDVHARRRRRVRARLRGRAPN